MARARRGDAERFRTMVESSPEGVCTLDAGDRLDFLNPRMGEMLGGEAEDLTGTPAALLFSAQDAAGLAEALAGCRAGRRERRELRLARRDAGTLPVLVSATAIAGRRGSPGGTLMMVTDLSARAAAEQRRERRLDSRLDGLSRLAGGVGHDFNNLMGVVVIYASLVEAEVEDRPDLQADLRDITAAARRAAALTQHLQAVGRHDAPVLEPLDLRALVGGAEDLLRPSLAPDVTVSVDVPGEPCVVRADRHRIERVLLNLAVNAGEAMPGGGAIAIGVDGPAPGPDGASRVTLRVRDEGEGMTPAAVERALEPFFTTRADPAGRGLGLTSVGSIAGEHGGSVDIESREGHGTTVSIHLRAAGADLPPARAPGPPARPQVLVVEDDPAVRDVTARLLEAQGMSVIACGDPDAALARPELDEGTVAVLLTDLQLPGMSGRALARRVRARLPRVAVVFMSGYADDPVAREAAGGAGAIFVGKPFSGAELAAGVRRAMASAAAV